MELGSIEKKVQSPKESVTRLECYSPMEIWALSLFQVLTLALPLSLILRWHS